MLFTGRLEYSFFYFIGLFLKHVNTRSNPTRSGEFGDPGFSYRVIPVVK